jgi:quercetin dioxygenase-like cupin family protein
MIIKNVLSLLENASGPVAKPLQHGEHGKVIVLGFKKGMVLKEHQTNKPTKLVIIDGSVIYRRAEAWVVMNKFEEMDIPVNVPHSVEALEDSICFLIQV